MKSSQWRKWQIFTLGTLACGLGGFGDHVRVRAGEAEDGFGRACERSMVESECCTEHCGWRVER